MLNAATPALALEGQNQAMATPQSVEEMHARIDELESTMLESGQLIAFDVQHYFTRGLYTRRIFMPAGMLATSKVHKTQHPYVVLSGSVSVFIPGEPVQHIQAPFMGVTEPGTRRVLYMHEDTVWITFHPNPDDEDDLEVIEQRLIERRELRDGKTCYELYVSRLAEQLTGNEMEMLREHEGQDAYGGAP